MRRSIVWRRVLPLIAGAAGALFFASWKVVRRFTSASTSPFAMWDFRAGVHFQALDQDMRRQTRRGFTCHTLLHGVRYCEMRAYGIDGMVRALVDSSDRVARIQFVPDSASPAMREEGRRLAATWNQLREPVADAPNARVVTTRWTTKDERWTASIRYGRLGRTPVVVQLTDEPAFARIANSTEALGPIALVMSNLADSAETRSAPDMAAALKQVQAGHAIDAGFATSPPAVSGVAAPHCEPVALDLGVQSGESRRDRFTDNVNAILEKAVAGAIRSQLVFGRDIRLIDSAGRAERVHIGPVDTDDAKGITAIAIQFSSRTTNAMDRLREKVPADFCHATAEVLIAHKWPNGTLKDVQRIVVGDDAATSNVTRLELVPASAAGDTAMLRVEYTATYGTDRWAGSLDWEVMISLESRRPLRRALLAFAHMTEETTMLAPGTIVMTRRQPDSIELATLEKHDWAFSTRTVIVPLSAGGVLEGISVLRSLLQQPIPNEFAKQ